MVKKVWDWVAWASLVDYQYLGSGSGISWKIYTSYKILKKDPIRMSSNQVQLPTTSQHFWKSWITCQKSPWFIPKPSIFKNHHQNYIIGQIYSNLLKQKVSFFFNRNYSKKKSREKIEETVKVFVKNVKTERKSWKYSNYDWIGRASRFKDKLWRVCCHISANKGQNHYGKWEVPTHFLNDLSSSFEISSLNLEH